MPNQFLNVAITELLLRLRLPSKDAFGCNSLIKFMIGLLLSNVTKKT